MKKTELLEFVPRKGRVILHARLKNVTDSGIILSTGHNAKENGSMTLTVLKKADNVEDLEIGDEVHVVEAALVEIEVSDAKDGETYFYTMENMIMFYKRPNKTEIKLKVEK